MKNIRPILEIIGEGIALAVLIVMVCQWSKMSEQNNLSRTAVEKMAEQNALSAASIARIDSTIQLMHEANELSKESNDLTKQYVGREAGKKMIEENRLQEELRPRLLIKALSVKDMKKDTACISILNFGHSNAERIRISTTIANISGILGEPQLYSLNDIIPNQNRVLAFYLPLKSGDLDILTEISYNWVLPSGVVIPFEEYKGQMLYVDSLTNEVVRCAVLQESDITEIFKRQK